MPYAKDAVDPLGQKSNRRADFWVGVLAIAAACAAAVMAARLLFY